MVTYLPVLGAKQFQFPCRVIFTDFLQSMSKLVQTGFCSAKPSTKKQSYRYDDGCLTEGYTEAAMCVKWWLQNFNM